MAFIDKHTAETVAAASNEALTNVLVPNEPTLAHYAAAFATGLRGGELVTLRGPLGAGKTSFVRALLHALGHAGVVRSPTFTLVEPYECGSIKVLHLDLYRLENAGELEFLGVREHFGEATILIEWPEKGAGWLPTPDIELQLDYSPGGRLLSANPAGPRGNALLSAWLQVLRGAALLPDSRLRNATRSAG